MNRDQIIEEITKNPDYLGICKKFTNGNEIYQDLYQEFILELLELKPQKIEKIYADGYLKWYCVRMLSNMFHSKTSRFAVKFKDIPKMLYEFEGYNFEKDIFINEVNYILENEYWYDRELLLLYIKVGSYRKLSKLTNIPMQSIFESVTSLKKRINEKISQRNGTNPKG